jgi:hypothetical protein
MLNLRTVQEMPECLFPVISGNPLLALGLVLSDTKQFCVVANELLLDSTECHRAVICPVAFQPSGLFRDIPEPAAWSHACLLVSVFRTLVLAGERQRWRPLTPRYP